MVLFGSWGANLSSRASVSRPKQPESSASLSGVGKKGYLPQKKMVKRNYGNFRLSKLPCGDLSFPHMFSLSKQSVKQRKNQISPLEVTGKQAETPQ